MRRLSPEVRSEIGQPLASAFMIAGATVFITWLAMRQKKPTGYGLVAIVGGAYLLYQLKQNSEQGIYV